MRIQNLLSRIPPFGDLDANSLDSICATFQRRRFAKGQIVLARGQKIEHIGVIADGAADFVLNRANHRKTVVKTIRKYDFFGPTNYYIAGVALVNVICSRNMVGFVQDIDDFREMTRHYPAIKTHFYRIALDSLWQAYQLRNKGRVPPFPETIPVFPAGGPEVPRNMEPALAYIDENYMESLTLAEMARRCNMSKYYFSRTFKSSLGISFKKYLIRCRIEAAKRLMREPDKNITEICFTVGFNDLSYFSKVFQKTEGVLPSQYRAGTGHKSLSIKTDL